jgi:hypothetical protein
MQEIHEKAIRRYQRDCVREGALYQQPGDVTYHRGLVTLSNIRGVLARYRVKRTSNRVRLQVC